jgi:uncharacterized protein (DUF3820 family)
MADQQPPATTVAPTYTERCAKYIEDNTKLSDEDQLAVTAALIAFSKQEYEKRRANASIMPFGKYKNKKIESIVAFDKPYLQWLAKQSVMENYPELRVKIHAVL